MAYPPISALPTPPSRQDPTNFANEADAFLGAIPTFQTETNTAGTYFDAQNAIATTQAGIATTQAGNAATSATSANASASAAEAASNAALWVSGTTYVAGDNVYAPSTFFTYRAKTGFVSTTDPASDSVNWVLVGVGGTAQLTTTNLTATEGQTAFSATYAAGAVVVTLNGVVLTITSDYTATDGSTVNLVTGASAGDNISVIGFPTFAIANTLPLTGGTLSGSLAGTTASFSGAISGASVTAASVAATGAVTAASGNISGEFVANSYNETYATLTPAATVDVNCETGNVFALTTAQATTFTFSNPPASGTAFGFTLKVTFGGVYTLTWPSSVDWAGGTAPDAPGSGETNVLVFITHDGGTTWYGFQGGAAMA